MNPVVSVIIPVFNASTYVRKCIDSIIQQTYQNLDIVIINDGSTDNSLDICKEYCLVDKRIKLITQINSGVSSARNQGIRNASGDWIIFVDADDWIDVDGIDNLVGLIRQYPQIDMIRSYSREMTHNGSSACTHDQEEHLYSRDEFLASDKIGGYVSSLFTKSSVIKNNNITFSTELQTKEDAVLTFQCVVNCKWILLSRNIFYNYYQNLASATRSPSVCKVFDHLKAASIIYKYSRCFNEPVVTKTAIKYLNRYLSCFIRGVCRVDSDNIPATLVRSHLVKYAKDNDLRLFHVSMQSAILLLIALIDYRILRGVYRLRRRLVLRPDYLDPK